MQRHLRPWSASSAPFAPFAPSTSSPVAALALALALAVGGTAACNSAPLDTPPAALTYHKDIRPLVESKCGGCHVAGGIGPMALDSYAAMVSYKGVVQGAVGTRQMPPWPPARGCTDYLEDRSMSDAEIAAMLKWIEAGQPEGDPADYKPPAARSGGLSRVDMHLQMAVDYTPQKHPDDYRCFILDFPATSTVYVSGFRANPGNGKIVHHVIAFLAQPGDVAAAQKKDDAEAGPGYTCFGAPGFGGNNVGWLGGWAPGSPGQDFPAGTGVKVVPGSKVVLQVHYNTLTSAPEPDRTSVDFKIDQTVAKQGVILPWVNPSWLKGKGMEIKAGDPDASHRFALDPTPYFGLIGGGALTANQPYTLWAASLHMHTLGTRGRIDLLRSDGTRECLLDIPQWDFHWQGSYGFVKEKPAAPGDQLSIECHWDNTAAHQPLGPDGKPLTPRDVYWGEGTTDEMCLGVMYVTQ